jgi:hypothetical protein
VARGFGSFDYWKGIPGHECRRGELELACHNSIADVSPSSTHSKRLQRIVPPSSTSLSKASIYLTTSYPSSSSLPHTLPQRSETTVFRVCTRSHPSTLPSSAPTSMVISDVSSTEPLTTMPKCADQSVPPWVSFSPLDPTSLYPK